MYGVLTVDKCCMLRNGQRDRLSLAIFATIRREMLTNPGIHVPPLKMPVPPGCFPVLLNREFAINLLENRENLPDRRTVGTAFAEFSLLIPCYQGIPTRDGFVIDCKHHHFLPNNPIC